MDADRFPHRIAAGIVGGRHLDDEIVLRQRRRERRHGDASGLHVDRDPLTRIDVMGRLGRRRILRRVRSAFELGAGTSAWSSGGWCDGEYARALLDPPAPVLKNRRSFHRLLIRMTAQQMDVLPGRVAPEYTADRHGARALGRECELG